MMLEWTTEGTGPRASQNASDETGRWRLSAPSDIVVAINYYPAKPAGETYKTISEKADTFHDDSYEYARLCSYIGIGDSQIGFAESFEEAKMLVEMLRVGNEGVAPWQETLSRNGFFQKYPDHESLKDYYARRLKGGSLSISMKHGAYIRYSGIGVNHWHNVASLQGDVPNYNQTAIVYTFFPPLVTDIQDIAALHMVRVMEARMAREHKRFSTPLGGAIPRFKRT